MAHGVEWLLVHFSVLMLKTEGSVWVFWKQKLPHTHQQELAVSWGKNIQHLSPWKIQVRPHSVRHKFSQQRDADHPPSQRSPLPPKG